MRVVVKKESQVQVQNLNIEETTASANKVSIKKKNLSKYISTMQALLVLAQLRRKISSIKQLYFLLQ